MAANKNGPWFRHYTDGHRNAKLRKLLESHQLFYFWLLELRKEGKYPCDVDELCWHLRVDRAVVVLALDVLTIAKLLTADGDIANWDERQYKYDSETSTKRVQRFRSKQTDVTCNGDETLHGNVPETPSEQSRAEQNRTEQSCSSILNLTSTKAGEEGESEGETEETAQANAFAGTFGKVPPASLMTEKQKSYLETLLASKGQTLPQAILNNNMRAPKNGHEVSFYQASKLITYLKALPDKATRPRGGSAKSIDDALRESGIVEP